MSNEKIFLLQICLNWYRWKENAEWETYLESSDEGYLKRVMNGEAGPAINAGFGTATRIVLKNDSVTNKTRFGNSSDNITRLYEEDR